MNTCVCTIVLLDCLVGIEWFRRTLDSFMPIVQGNQDQNIIDRFLMFVEYFKCKDFYTKLLSHTTFLLALLMIVGV